MKQYRIARVEWHFRTPPHRDDEYIGVVSCYMTGSGYYVELRQLYTPLKWLAKKRWEEYKNPEECDAPLPDEPHVPDVDEAAYFNYWRF